MMSRNKHNNCGIASRASYPGPGTISTCIAYCVVMSSHAHARVDLESHPPNLSQRKVTFNMKALLVLIATLVLQLVSAKFEFTDEWEHWKKVAT